MSHCPDHLTFSRNQGNALRMGVGSSWMNSGHGTTAIARGGNLVKQGTEDLCLDVLRLMSGSPQPGAAVIERMLDDACPDPDRVQIERSA